MKKSTRSLLVVFLLGGLVLSCENPSHGESSVTGKIITQSTCKSNAPAYFSVSAVPDSISSVEYVFDSVQHKLSMKHINAAFNCCPGTLSCRVVLRLDTIIIQEREKESLCDCNCLYDLELELNGVGAKPYFVKLEEPYATVQPILFEMDLSQQTQGLFQVIRTYYPWGMSAYE